MWEFVFAMSIVQHDRHKQIERTDNLLKDYFLIEQTILFLLKTIITLLVKFYFSGIKEVSQYFSSFIIKLVQSQKRM